jgi:hypothetical protein
VISGIPVAVDQATLLDDGLAVGEVVRVRGLFLEGEGGTWQARSIRRVPQGERRFEFVGLVESIAPWVVSGIDVEIRAWTEIVDPIEVGDRVKVEGRILPDGAWLADEIKLAGEDDELEFEFVGRVQSIDPWNVGGISLAVDQQTEIADPIDVGDRVKVEGHILPDGAWLADEIVRVETPFGRGCMQITSIVVRLDANLLVLQDGTTIPMDGTVLIEGQIQVNSVILFVLCIDDQGHATIVSVVVLYRVEPLPIVTLTPSPPQAPPGDDDDDRDDGERQVTICHHAQGKSGVRTTITVGWSAWVNSHSRHGDTLGPCE